MVMVHEHRSLYPPPDTTQLLTTLTRRAVEWSIPILDVLLFFSMALVSLEAKAQMEQWGMRWEREDLTMATSSTMQEKEAVTAADSLVQDEAPPHQHAGEEKMEEEEDEEEEDGDDEEEEDDEKTATQREKKGSSMTLSAALTEEGRGGGGGAPGLQRGSVSSSTTGRARGKGKQGKRLPRRGRGRGGGGEKGTCKASSSSSSPSSSPIFSFTAFMEDVRRWKLQWMHQCVDASNFIVSDSRDTQMDVKKQKREDDESERGGTVGPSPSSPLSSSSSVRYVLDAEEVRHGPATTTTAAMCLLLYAADAMERRRQRTVTSDRPAGGAAVACSTRDMPYLVHPEAEEDEEDEDDEEEEEDARLSSSSSSVPPMEKRKRPRQRRRTFNFSASSIFHAFVHTPARYFTPGGQSFSTVPPFPFPLHDPRGLPAPPHRGGGPSSSSFLHTTSDAPLFVPFVSRSTPRYRHPFRLPPLPPDPLHVFFLPILERVQCRCLTSSGVLVRLREWLLNDATLQWGKVEKADEVVRLRNWKRLQEHRERQWKKRAAWQRRCVEGREKKIPLEDETTSQTPSAPNAVGKEECQKCPSFSFFPSSPWTPSDEVLLNDGTFLSLHLRHTSFIIRAPVQWSWRSPSTLLRPSSVAVAASPRSLSFHTSRSGSGSGSGGDDGRGNPRWTPSTSTTTTSPLSSLPRFFHWDGVEGSVLQYGVGSLQLLPPLPPPWDPLAPHPDEKAPPPLSSSSSSSSSTGVGSVTSGVSASAAPLTARQVRRLAVRPFLDVILQYDEAVRRDAQQREEEERRGWGGGENGSRHPPPHCSGERSWHDRREDEKKGEGEGGLSRSPHASSSVLAGRAAWTHWWCTASFRPSSSRMGVLVGKEAAIPSVEEFADFLSRLAVPLRGTGEASAMHLLSRPHALWVETVLQRERPEVYLLAREKGIMEWRVRASRRSAVLLYVTHTGKEVPLGPPAALAMTSPILYPPPPPPTSSSLEEEEKKKKSGTWSMMVPRRVLLQQHDALQTALRRLWRGGEWLDCQAYVQLLLSVKAAEAAVHRGGRPWVECLVLVPHTLGSAKQLLSSSNPSWDVLGCIPLDVSLLGEEEEDKEEEEEALQEDHVLREAAAAVMVVPSPTLAAAIPSPTPSSLSRSFSRSRSPPPPPPLATTTSSECTNACVGKNPAKKRSVIRWVTAYPLSRAEEGVFTHILQCHPQGMCVKGCGVQQLYLCTSAGIGEWTEIDDTHKKTTLLPYSEKRIHTPLVAARTTPKEKEVEGGGGGGGVRPTWPRETHGNVWILLRRSCGVVLRWSLACCYAPDTTAATRRVFPVAGEWQKTVLRPPLQAVWVPHVLPLARLPATSGRKSDTGASIPPSPPAAEGSTTSHGNEKKNENLSKEPPEEKMDGCGSTSSSRRSPTTTTTAASAAPPMTKAFFDSLLRYYLHSLLSKWQPTPTHRPSSPDPRNETTTGVTVKEKEEEEEANAKERPPTTPLPPPPSSGEYRPNSLPSDVRHGRFAPRTTLYPTDRHLLFHALRHHPRYWTHVKGCGIRELYIACRKVDQRTEEEKRACLREGRGEKREKEEDDDEMEMEEEKSKTNENTDMPVKNTDNSASEQRSPSSPSQPHGEEEQEVAPSAESSSFFFSSSSSVSSFRHPHRSVYRPLLLLEYACGKVVPANDILAECFSMAPPHAIWGHQEMVVKKTNEGGTPP